MDGPASSDIVSFMKIVRIIATALALSAAAPVSAGVLPDARQSAPDSPAVTAVRALLSRCMPPVLAGEPLVTAGLVRADAGVSDKLLGDRQGQVWTDRSVRMVLIGFDDVPVCRVIGLKVDPLVLGDLVLRVFDEAETPFRQQRFRIDKAGGFAAVYAMEGARGSVLVTISTAVSVDGSPFATLTMERSAPLSN